MHISNPYDPFSMKQDNRLKTEGGMLLGVQTKSEDLFCINCWYSDCSSHLPIPTKIIPNNILYTGWAGTCISCGKSLLIQSQTIPFNATITDLKSEGVKDQLCIYLNKICLAKCNASKLSIIAIYVPEYIKAIRGYLAQGLWKNYEKNLY